MTARYDGIDDWYQAWVTQLSEDPALTALLAMADPCGSTDTLLDLGCGEGRVARALASGGASVVGVDLSAGLLDRARAAEVLESTGRRGISYIEGDAATTSWWNGTPFDGVVSNMALSDIEDLNGALETVAAVLAEGGWFAFTILHPCFPGSGDWLPSWSPGGYFEERWWSTGRDGVRGRVGAHHRTLSSYLNALVQAGLSIETTSEPEPPTADVPTWLGIKCRRTQPKNPPR